MWELLCYPSSQESESFSIYSVHLNSKEDRILLSESQEIDLDSNGHKA